MKVWWWKDDKRLEVDADYVEVWDGVVESSQMIDGKLVQTNQIEPQDHEGRILIGSEEIWTQRFRNTKVGEKRPGR